MYWLLNCLPIIIEVLYGIFTYFGNNNQGAATTFTIIWMFVITPIYLLFVNFHYININVTSYLKVFILTLIIFIIRIGYMLIFHWLKCGNFIGDVPIQIYHAMVVAPSIIVIVGLVIHYLTKSR